jgi:short subunit dehydrogenase-like uncharacterized protein
METRRVFGTPTSRVKGHVRGGTLSLSGGTVASARATFEAVARDLSLVAILKDPFALTPGFKGVKQPPANKVVYEEDLESWAAPFTMATLNTRNVHRSNMLMGFPYGTEFVYDEMVLTGLAKRVRSRPRLWSLRTPARLAPERQSPAKDRQRKSGRPATSIYFMSRSRLMAAASAHQ